MIIRKKKLRKKVIKRIQKEKRKNRAFSYLTKFVGRGAKDFLKRLHQINEDGEITKTHFTRKEIEEQLMNYNKKHCKKISTH